MILISNIFQISNHLVSKYSSDWLRAATSYAMRADSLLRTALSVLLALFRITTPHPKFFSTAPRSYEKIEDAPMVFWCVVKKRTTWTWTASNLMIVESRSTLAKLVKFMKGNLYQDFQMVFSPWQQELVWMRHRRRFTNESEGQDLSLLVLIVDATRALWRGRVTIAIEFNKLNARAEAVTVADATNVFFDAHYSRTDCNLRWPEFQFRKVSYMSRKAAPRSQARNLIKYYT